MHTGNITRTTAQALMLCLAMLMCGTTRAQAQGPLSDEEIYDFVASYLDSTEGRDPDDEVEHYAGRVDYFNSGVVSRGFVANDQRRYYSTWPSRTFTLLDPPEILDRGRDYATLRFALRYVLKGPGRRTSGVTENTMRVKLYDGQLYIVAMSERRVPTRGRIVGRSRGPSSAPVAKLAVAKPRPEPREERETRKSERNETRDREESRAVAKAETKPKAKPEPKPKPKKTEVAEADPEPKAKPAPEAEPETKAKPQERNDTKSRTQTAAAKLEADEPEPEDPAVKRLRRATPVENSPGYVYLPGAEKTASNMLDVRGYPSGAEVKDPKTGNTFLVP